MWFLIFVVFLMLVFGEKYELNTSRLKSNRGVKKS